MSRQFMFLIAIAGTLGAIAVPGTVQNENTVYRVPVTGEIELGLAPYIQRAVKEAAEVGAAALILDIDTPGGRVDAAEIISDALTDSEVPVYSLVNRRAYSAGALIALSTSRIYMRPASVIGAATPVDGTGTKAPEKIVSAMRSQMRALAEANGLEPEVAAAMVDEDIEIDGVVESGKLLTLTTEEAVEIGYAEAIEDLDALLVELGQEGATVVTLELNWAERLVRFFSSSVVSPFLLSLGFLGLLIEIRTPTFGLAGTMGLISLGLFFGSNMIVGLAGLEDVLIVGAGLVLLGIEAFVVPGFGIFGVAGIVAILAGLYMSLLGNIPTMPDFTRAAWVLTSSMLLLIGSAWALIRTLPGSSRLAESGIFLLAKTASAIGYESAEVRSDLVGKHGTAITDLRPAGTALVGDERIDVVSESEWISAGTPVKVLSAEGYRHIVRSVSEQEAEEA
ncbi:MAG: NfeD family protein [bacterium]|nr:nodulation protein NfeD [Gemmatimonadota bacterium]HIL89692.1 nodulation protein NfeD [Gemmatimonadota bacterium]